MIVVHGNSGRTCPHTPIYVFVYLYLFIYTYVSSYIYIHGTLEASQELS